VVGRKIGTIINIILAIPTHLKFNYKILTLTVYPGNMKDEGPRNGRH